MFQKFSHPNKRFLVRLLVALCLSVIAICSYFAIPTARSAPAEQKFNGKIVYSTDRDSVALDIVSINPDGSGRTRITDDQPGQFGTFDFSPAWSPDGAKLAFVSTREDRFPQIYTMNADGTNITRLTDETASAGDPAWSPDGAKIAFTRGGGCVTVGIRDLPIVNEAEDEDPCTPLIFSINIDGSNRVNLSEMPGFGAVWSPDGTKIAFTSPDANFQTEIFIMNADGSNRFQLTDTPTNEFVSSWSPDGARLLFTSNQDSPPNEFLNEIYSMKVDGTDIVRLTNNQTDEQLPVFSPDGTKIAFQLGVFFGFLQNSEIIVMNADGSNPTNLTNSDSEDFGRPAWQPLSAPPQFPPPAVLQFESPTLNVNENNTTLQINVLRSGNTAEAVSAKVDSADATASDVSDYTRLFETLHFAPGETSKSISLLLNDDSFVEGTETFVLTMHDLTGNSIFANSGSTTVSILDNEIAPSPPLPNPLDNSEFFVRQHYHDFLNREPDTEGLAFWVNNIESCGSDAICRELKRIDTSAAFFLSIEFQRTGFYVFRIWVATERSPSFIEFMRDTQSIGKDLIVGAQGWEQQLDANSQRFTEEFISRRNFRRLFPETLPADIYVDLLYSRAGLTPAPPERARAIAAFGSGDTAGRARALRIVVDNATFVERLFTSCFVQEQYFGYLRREFDFEGFLFWRGKLDSFNGDFRKAEMVKAFLHSSEYRSRFGAP